MKLPFSIQLIDHPNVKWLENFCVSSGSASGVAVNSENKVSLLEMSLNSESSTFYEKSYCYFAFKLMFY